MAKKVNIQLESDLSGKPGETTITFGLDGINYEIDLTSSEAEKLNGLLKPYTDVARRIGRTTGKPGPRTKVPSDTKAIKAWADSQGISYPQRGRLPAELIAQWEAAEKA